MKAVYLKDKTGNKVVTTPYYRIGDLFLTTIAENPSSYLGGTWELFGPGRTLVCVDTSQTEFNSVKKTGGSKYLQAHNHSFNGNTNDSGSHTHGVFGFPSSGGSSWGLSTASGAGGKSDSSATGGIVLGIAYSSGNHGHYYSGNTSSQGSGSSQNLQPFITCYIWIRTA